MIPWHEWALAYVLVATHTARAHHNPNDGWPYTLFVGLIWPLVAIAGAAEALLDAER